MKILFEVRHPAHIHHFKNIIEILKRKNHEIKIVAADKDILRNLLDSLKYDYVLIGSHKTGLANKLKEIMYQTKKVYRICKTYKPDIVVGRPSQTITLSSFLLGIPSIIFAEDDLKVVLLNGLIALPFANTILTPEKTDLGIFNRKKIPYKGYQKVTYLHPNQFKPNIHLIEKYVDTSRPIFLLRFSKLNASHDLNISGINNNLALDIVKRLKPHGIVYISSERTLSTELSAYKLKLPAEHIHHLLYFSKLYIGDSQSMAVESAILGTPGIRYSDFAGKISVLEELEHTYKLTFGIPTNQPDKLFNKIDELLSEKELDKIFKERGDKLKSEIIDVAEYNAWFIDQFPASKKIMKTNPDYQYKFR